MKTSGISLKIIRYQLKMEKDLKTHIETYTVEAVTDRELTGD